MQPPRRIQKPDIPVLLKAAGRPILMAAEPSCPYSPTPWAYVVRDSATLEPVGVELFEPDARALALAYRRACFVDRLRVGVVRNPGAYDTVYEVAPEPPRRGARAGHSRAMQAPPPPS